MNGTPGAQQKGISVRNFFFSPLSEGTQPALDVKTLENKDKANYKEKPGWRKSTFFQCFNFSPGISTHMDKAHQAVSQKLH